MTRIGNSQRIFGCAGIVTMLSGCSLLHLALGYEDRAAMREVQDHLKCGMTVPEIQRTAQLPVVSFEAPDKNGVAHYVHRNFANLGLVMREGKLQASQLNVIDNLTSSKLEREINHCNIAKGHV